MEEWNGCQAQWWNNEMTMFYGSNVRPFPCKSISKLTISLEDSTRLINTYLNDTQYSRLAHPTLIVSSINSLRIGGGNTNSGGAICKMLDINTHYAIGDYSGRFFSELWVIDTFTEFSFRFTSTEFEVYVTDYFADDKNYFVKMRYINSIVTINDL